jgi:hypothetical protein
MSQILFKNRWFAAIFAGMTLLSVAVFVSEGGQGDALTDMADELHEQRESAEQPNETTEPAESSQPEAAPTEFLSDEELIDDGSGMDSSGDQTEPDSEAVDESDDGADGYSE